MARSIVVGLAGVAVGAAVLGFVLTQVVTMNAAQEPPTVEESGPNCSMPAWYTIEHAKEDEPIHHEVVGLAAADVGSLVRGARLSEPAFERASVPLSVIVDAALANRSAGRLRIDSSVPEPKRHIRGENQTGRVRWTEDKHLRITCGTGGGLSGESIELHVATRKDGTLEVHSTAADSWDFGPPFSEYWTKVSGRVTVASCRMQPGDTLLMDVDVFGTLDKRERNFHCELEVHVP